eukprot:2169179-Prymnesium_polylepis.1
MQAVSLELVHCLSARAIVPEQHALLPPGLLPQPEPPQLPQLSGQHTESCRIPLKHHSDCEVAVSAV